MDNNNNTGRIAPQSSNHLPRNNYALFNKEKKRGKIGLAINNWLFQAVDREHAFRIVIYQMLNNLKWSIEITYEQPLFHGYVIRRHILSMLLSRAPPSMSTRKNELHERDLLEFMKSKLMSDKITPSLSNAFKLHESSFLAL